MKSARWIHAGVTGRPESRNSWRCEAGRAPDKYEDRSVRRFCRIESGPSNWRRPVGQPLQRQARSASSRSQRSTSVSGSDRSSARRWIDHGASKFDLVHAIQTFGPFSGGDGPIRQSSAEAGGAATAAAVPSSDRREIRPPWLCLLSGMLPQVLIVTLDAPARGDRTAGYDSLTLPAQNCCFCALASMSYLRTKVSFPSSPMR